MGEREERARARETREGCLLLARSFFLVPTESKRLLRRLAEPTLPNELIGLHGGQTNGSRLPIYLPRAPLFSRRTRFLPWKRFSPGLSRPVEVKDVYVHWVLRLILRWNPLGNWVISTFSGQKPCTRIISSILHSFLRPSNKLYEITPKERFLWEPEKINFKSFQLNKTKFYTWRFYLCFNSCEICYYIHLITSIALKKCKKDCNMA